MGRLSAAESFERQKFITDRLLIGYSRVTIELQFREKFGVKETIARSSYQAAKDSLVIVEPDSASTRASLLEILHHQLVQTNIDIAKVTDELNLVLETRQARADLDRQILNSIDKGESDRLKLDLKSLPVHRAKYFLSCLDQRSRFRSMATKFVTEIARLNGLYVEELPILRAIQIMANSELIPADTAKSLSSLLENLETSIDRVGKAAVSDSN